MLNLGALPKADVEVSVNVPPLTVVVPPKVLAPPKITVPVFVGLPITNEYVLAPSSMLLFMLRVAPAEAFKYEGVATPISTAPLMLPVLALLLLVIVPPFRLIALAMVLPSRSKVPPALMVNVPVPNGPEVTVPVVGVEFVPALKVPPLMVVPPVNVLGPDKVSEPAVKLNLPPAPLIVPLYVPLALLRMRDLAPKFTPPVPLKETIDALVVTPLISNVPVTATLLFAIEPLPVRAKLPALIVVKPL